LLAVPIFAVHGGRKRSKGIKNPASFLQTGWKLNIFVYFCLYRKQFQAIMMDALIVTFVDRLKQKAAEDAEKGTFDAATDTDGLSKNANQLVSY
jgi:hypothetical protein